MKTGCSYFGVRRLEHVRRDMAAMRAEGHTHVLHTWSEDDQAYYRDTMGRIIEISREEVPMLHSNKVSRRMVEALMAEKLGRHDVLEVNLRKLIQLRPDHAHAYNALGYSLAERNQRLAEAEQLIFKALQLSPDDPFIIDSMGWVLYRKGDPAGALSHLQRAHSIRPDPEIAAHLGEVLWVLGRRDEARRTWQEAAQVHPGNEVLVEVIKRFAP